MKYGHLWKQIQTSPDVKSDIYQPCSPLMFSSPQNHTSPEAKFTGLSHVTSEQSALHDLTDIVNKMLQVNPANRPTARQLMQMPFFTNEPKQCMPREITKNLFRNKEFQANEYFARERLKANAQLRKP